MLGSVKQAWNWIGSGKHPAIRDFFKVGQSTPILEAIADWLENGFQRFMAKEERRRDGLNANNSWRFWMKSPKAGQLVVGVVRDSSDSLGRPYPLLVAGTGPFKEVEKKWDLLPFVCEKIWGQMEYIGTGQFADVNQIEDRVSHIYPPDRKSFRRTGPEGAEDADPFLTKLDQMPAAVQAMEQHVAPLLHQPEFIVPIDPGATGDPILTAGLWHKVFKNKLAVFPNALFMGGGAKEPAWRYFNGHYRRLTLFSSGLNIKTGRGMNDGKRKAFVLPGAKPASKSLFYCVFRLI